LFGAYKFSPFFSEQFLSSYTLKHNVTFNCHYFEVSSREYAFFYFYSLDLNSVLGFPIPLGVLTRYGQGESFEKFLDRLPTTTGGIFRPVVGYKGKKSFK